MILIFALYLLVAFQQKGIKFQSKTWNFTKSLEITDEFLRKKGIFYLFTYSLFVKKHNIVFKKAKH